MTTVQQRLTQEGRYLAAFLALEKNGFGKEPLWLRTLRKAAISRFSELGFPTTRRGNEEWKYTDVGPIAAAPFEPIATPVPSALKPSELQRFTFGAASKTRLTFVDGYFVEKLSSLPSLPPAVKLINLAEAMAARPNLAEQHLASQANYQTNAFTALNTALFQDGAFLLIPDGTLLEEPIHLLFLSTPRMQATASYPRVLIVVGRDAKATVIESYGGPADGQYLTNAATEVVVGQGSAVKYFKLQQQSEQAFHITTTQVALARNASFSSFNLDLGGRLVRNNLNVLMGGEGSSCTLNGLYLVTGSQHVDNQVIIDHASSFTTARELYKGVLGGKARSVFHGSIAVRKGVKKVDAQQTDKNLLLSDQAEADTKPAFWIDADDVKCGHGAACGKLDENALFYLRSRGIGESAARAMLVRAFASELVDTITTVPLHTFVDVLVMAKLQQL